MIRIFPSRVEGEALETHRPAVPTRLDEWLSEVVGHDIAAHDIQPINIDLNGVTLLDFAVVVHPDDDVRIYPNVNAGVAIGTIVYWSAVGIALALSLYMYLNMPKTGASNSQAQGDDLDTATARANQAKPNQVVRESFGHQRVYPDYILPPFKRFVDLRSQFNYFCMAVGVGEYDIVNEQVLIGDTPVSVFGDDVEYNLYAPGEPVGKDPKGEFWHVVTEVGGTTTGVGLDLASTSSTASAASVSAVLANGHVLSTVNGTDTWPESWNVGLVLAIALPQQITVSVGTGGRSRLSGIFTDLAPFVGMKVTLSGSEEGDFTIQAYSPAVAPVPGTGGSPSSILGSAAPTTYNYISSPVVFTITFQGVTKVIQLVANYVNMSGLISTITDQLAGSALVAQDSSGRVRIVEPSSPYLGGAITASGLPVAVFGATPTFTTGTASTGGTPGQAAYIELNFDDGTPVIGMANGDRRFAIGYRNLQFVVTAFSPTDITVNRLNEAGVVNGSWPGWTTRYLTDETVSTNGAGSTGVDWVGPFMACPENEKTETVEFDIFLPQGIGLTTSKGEFGQYFLSVDIQWRDAATGGPWTTINWSYLGKTPDQIGFTETIDLPYAMRPQVRMRRITPVDGDNRHRDAINWYGLRARLEGPVRYKDISVLTMAVRGGNRLSQQSENKVSMEVLRHIDGVPTRDILRAILYILGDLGVPSSAIDLDTLNSVSSTFWVPRGENYDHQHTVQQTARDTLQGMMAAGMSHLTLSNGKVSTRREGVQSMPTQIISPMQMTKEMESQFAVLSPDDYDGVNVEFLSADTWAVETVECRLDVENPVKIEKLTLDGVTDRDRAWRIGMRQLRKRRLQRWQYRIETELDALNCEYLDRVALTEDAVDFGQSALILEVAGDVVTLSEPLNWTAVAQPRVRVRRHDGSATINYTPVRIDDYTMQIPGLDFAPDVSFAIEPAVVIFGDLFFKEYGAMITEISPDSEGICQVSAVEYRADLYADDDNNAP